jgi:hypothetical protein
MFIGELKRMEKRYEYRGVNYTISVDMGNISKGPSSAKNPHDPRWREHIIVYERVPISNLRKVLYVSNDTINGLEELAQTKIDELLDGRYHEIIRTLRYNEFTEVK